MDSFEVLASEIKTDPNWIRRKTIPVNTQYYSHILKKIVAHTIPKTANKIKTTFFIYYVKRLITI